MDRAQYWSVFIDSRRQVPDIGGYINDPHMTNVHGQLYLDKFYIESYGEKWILTIGNQIFQSQVLHDLETRLFEFAMSEGLVDSYLSKRRAPNKPLPFTAPTERERNLRTLLQAWLDKSNFHEDGVTVTVTEDFIRECQIVLEDTETVDSYLRAHGITLPVLERDDWAHISAKSNVGQEIIKLWIESKNLLSMMHDSSPKLISALVHQCDVLYFG